MSINDLYNNFKIVEQEVKKSVGASTGTQNMAFMTTLSTGSTNDVNTANSACKVSTVNSNVNTASSSVSTVNISDNVVYAFMLSLLSMRAKRYYQRTGKKIFINANDTTGYDKSKVECFNCHKMGHFVRECRAPRNKDGLDEFKEPEFNGYGPRDTVLKSTIDYEKESDNSKENTDDSLEKEQVFDNENSSVESSPNVVKETIFHAAKKVEFVKPKNNEKPVKKPVRKRMVTGNNYNRVDYGYYAKTSHPNTHRNMTPRAVLLKSGLKPLSTARLVYTAHPKPTVHSARPMTHFSKQAQSTIHRPFYKKPTLTNRANGVNAVKPLACWVWRPTRPNGASLGNPQLNDKGFVDSGCSRHMTGNIAYLSNFKEFDGGHVTFGGGAYGGRISGKGTLKTDSLDFDDVYFVKELKFNLFSVSQMCDKKNYVLFTDTECLVLSPDFKLPDESQILLKIPRKDNMYSFDMKNIVPKESLTCLAAKATLDESMLWHRRLVIMESLVKKKWCMTRSSTKELLSPLENPERVLRSRRKLFDNPSLVETNSPESDQLSEIEEHIEEEEVTEIMAETMEQYMSKTRENYGSGITRPTINQDTPFELKGQFLKELRDNTFSGSEHEDANEHIEKVLEIVDLFHIPKVTQDQIMLRAFPVSLTGAASRWLRNQPSGSITTWEILKTKFLNKYCPPARTAKKMEEINNFQQEPDESLFRAWERFKELLMKCPQHYLTDMQEVILFYNGLDVPTRQILDSKGTETSDGLAAIQAQLNNLRREIKKVNEKVYAAQVGCEQCKGPHYTKDCPQKEEGKTLEEAYYTQFGAPYQPGGQYRAAGPGFYQRNNGNSSYPARRETMEESLAKFMAESAKRHEENSNIIKEIRASTDAAIRNQGASIKTLELQIGQMSKVLQERGFGSLPSSTETNPKDQVKLISTATADLSEIRRMEHYPYAVSGPQHRFMFPETVPFPRRLHNYCCDDLKEARGVNILDTYDSILPQKEKDPGSFTLPCLINNICFDKALVDLGASVSVMPFFTYSNLGLGNLSHTMMTIELVDKTIKQPRGIASNVLVRIGKFVFPIDFVILDIPEDGDIPLILGRPFLSTAHAKIDVYKRKVTLRVGEEKLVFKSIKPASSIIKRVFMDE
ncbi:hypothetical protein Tco_1336794 [Tanacetum coccineum]